MKYWVMKSEPDVYGIDHLYAQKRKTDHWDGIRNYQARKFIPDEMKTGALSFFYHSNCDQPGIVGIMDIVSSPYSDHTAFNPEEKYFDAKSDPKNPRWYMVDVRFKKKFKKPVTLKTLKQERVLAQMRLVQRGNRLSILPVSSKEWKCILKIAGEL